MIGRLLQRAPRWLVVGADGLIGRALVDAAAAPGRAVVGTTRRRGGEWMLDLEADPRTWTLPARVRTAFLCAAITKLDACERQPQRARAVNVIAAEALARRFIERGAHVVFASSNQVFDGSRPHTPADAPPSAASCYGRLKREAEERLLALGPAVTVVRLTKVFESILPLLRRWAAALGDGRPIEPFVNMHVAPVPLAQVVRVLIAAGERRPEGIVQLSGPQDVTYASLALGLAARLGVDDALVRPIHAVEAGLKPDPTPRYTTLDTTRARLLFDFRCPPADALLDAAMPGFLPREREHV